MILLIIYSIDNIIIFTLCPIYIPNNSYVYIVNSVPIPIFILTRIIHY